MDAALHLLPVALHMPARRFLDWLGAVSDSTPARCPDCGSRQRTIRCGVGPRCRRTLYACSHCGKTYNALTDTPLAGLHHPDRWQGYMALRFAGLSVRPATERLGISTHAACTWDRQFLEAMREHAPALHRWWLDHQHQGNRAMPDHYQQPCDAFVAWVADMARAPGRLAGTPFHRMAFRSRWVPFARLLISGASDVEMSKALAISAHCASQWRARFQKAIEQRHPELLGWRGWQRARRYNEASVWFSGKASHYKPSHYRQPRRESQNPTMA